MKTKTNARREAFLSAAQQVFEEVGFDQATMSEIVARVGSSKATLYRYFDSKEALFLELVRRSAQEHEGGLMSLLNRCGGCGNAVSDSGHILPVEAMEAFALLDLNETVATSLKRFGRQVLKSFHTPHKLATLRMVIAAAATNKQIGQLFYENGPTQGMRYIERYFENAMKAGQLRQADPYIVARHFRGLLESEVHEAGLFNVVTTLDDDYIAAVVDRAVEVFMRAYGT